MKIEEVRKILDGIPSKEEERNQRRLVDDFKYLREKIPEGTSIQTPIGDLEIYYREEFLRDDGDNTVINCPFEQADYGWYSVYLKFVSGGFNGLWRGIHPQTYVPLKERNTYYFAGFEVTYRPAYLEIGPPTLENLLWRCLTIPPE